MSAPSLSTLRLHLVGCGNMGRALLRAWLAAGVLPQHVTARTGTAESAARLSTETGIHASPQAVYDKEDVVVFAVKPQTLNTVLAAHWATPPAAPLYLSIAAGKPLAYFSARLGKGMRVIRCMPNTPSLVGKGVTTLVAGGATTTRDRQITEHLFRACGSAIWLESEAQLDIATAIAGSGPAYLFHFAEALMQNAQALGLDAATAQALVQGTFTGSVALADARGWEALEQLRTDVTSKGGVTAAALDVLMPELPDLLKRALEANIRRSKSLT